MKKVLMSVALVSAIAITAGYSMIVSEKSDVNMSELTQANVEALAQSVGVGYPCAHVSNTSCGAGYDGARGIIQYPER